MGNQQVLDKGSLIHIESEFNRLKKSKNYLTFQETLQIKPYENANISLNHIGILYMIDSTKTGRITQQNLENFASFAKSKLKQFQSCEFQNIIQSYCLIELLKFYKSNKKATISWIETALLENEHKNNSQFCKIESLHFIYDIFKVQIMMNCEIGDFVALFQNLVSDPMQFIQNSQKEKGLIPYILIRNFLNSFFDGLSHLTQS